MRREAQAVRANREVYKACLELEMVQGAVRQSAPPEGQRLEVVASIKGPETQQFVVQWTQREGATMTKHFAVLEPKQALDVKAELDQDRKPVIRAQALEMTELGPGARVSLHGERLARGYHKAIDDRDTMKRALEREERQRQRELNPKKERGGPDF